MQPQAACIDRDSHADCVVLIAGQQRMDSMRDAFPQK